MAVSLCRSRLPALLALVALSSLASAQQIVGWGNNGYGQLNVPPLAQSGVVAVATGQYHSLALKSGGSVVGWGSNGSGQISVPSAAGYSVVAVAAGYAHSLALKSDGSVIGWGFNGDGQTTTPVAAQSGVVAIAAGSYHSLALKSDGSVVAWGYNGNGQATVPPAAQSGVVAIAAGQSHSLALKSDGSVVAWGGNGYGQITVPAGARSSVVAIAAGGNHSLALRSNGDVVVWGYNGYGQTTVPAAAHSGVVAIAGGQNHSLALKSDGSVVAWGDNSSRQTVVPATAGSGIGNIAAGGSFSLALRQRATVSLAPSAVWGGDASVGTVKLVGPAGTGGVTVALASNDAAVHVPASVKVAAGATSATFPITTDAWFGSYRSVTVAATYDGTYSLAYLLVKGTSASAAFDHPDIAGGSTTSLFLKVDLSTAVASDTTFALASTGPLSGVPATVTVPADATEVKVPLTTAQVTTAQAATATLSYGGSSLGTATIQVLPITGTVKFAADRIVSGESTTGTVYLKAATVSAVTVQLASGDGSVRVPASVTVPAGGRTTSFSVATDPALRTADVAITATVGNVSFSKDLRVTAATAVKSVSGPSAVYGGAKGTFTVTLSRPAGVGGYPVEIASSGLSAPFAVTVPEGATSVTFEATADDVDAIATGTVSVTGLVNAVSTTSSVRPNVMAGFMLSANTVTSGGSFTGTLTLKAPVAVDTVVALSSGDPLVSVPATVTILAGSKTGTFTATAGVAAKSKNVTITATKSGASLSKGVKVLP